MKLQEALEKFANARKAGWMDLTVGPEDPKDRDDCFVIGIDPKDHQRKKYEEASEAVEAKPEAEAPK